ncbi:MAG: hypothetical protein ACOWW1_06820 [archaeon]|nr:hypothetical protein [Candidatus Bathyarchaeum sp.]
MKNKNSFCIVLLLLALMSSYLFGSVFAQVTVGVKQGNMIQYDVECTGDVPKQHDVSSAKIEVVNVRDKLIDIKFTSVYLDGTEKIEYSTLNLQTGNLGEGFIIPANLTEGDTFFEKNYGNITISKIEERAYAGQKRITVTASNPQNLWYWDQETGFLVEAKSTYANFTIVMEAKETNIWEPQNYEMDPVVAIVLVVAIIAVLLVIVVFRVLKK